MAGPYPPPQPAGPEGQPFSYPAGSPPYPPDQPYAYPAGYPGSLPPPVRYPPPRRGRRLWWLLGALAVIGALTAAVVLLGGSRPAAGSRAFSDSTAKTAIQDYLNALSGNDTETVARNNACGMFDAITDRKSDLALARLASDAFRKQFDRAEVTSIDKIVLSSPFQAQVLFTMRVASASTARNARTGEQGVAQLLRTDDGLLVCSYLLRTGGQY